MILSDIVTFQFVPTYYQKKKIQVFLSAVDFLFHQYPQFLLQLLSRELLVVDVHHGVR